MQAEAKYWVYIILCSKKIWSTFFFFLLIIFLAIWICQFTASLHVYNTAFLQQLSLSHNAVVHLVCWVAGHNTIENSSHLKTKKTLSWHPFGHWSWALEKAGIALAAFSNMSNVPALLGLLIHHQCLIFSKIQFRVHLPETWSFFPFADLRCTGRLQGGSLGAWLASTCFQTRKKMGESRRGASANKSYVQTFEISMKWIKIALSLTVDIFTAGLQLRYQNIN